MEINYISLSSAGDKCKNYKQCEVFQSEIKVDYDAYALIVNYTCINDFITILKHARTRHAANPKIF